MSTAVLGWFEGGGPVMPALLLLGVVLYALLIERTLALLGGQLFDPEVSLGIVRALIAAAPLLGLLGTVGGMIDGFSALLGDADMGRIGVGIGHALRTTQYGMALAAPALLAERILSRRAEVVR